MRSEKLHYDYKIFNNGPSDIKMLSVAVQVPTAFLVSAKLRVPIVDFNFVTAECFYHNKVYKATWMKNDKIFVPLIEENLLEFYQKTSSIDSLSQISDNDENFHQKLQSEARENPFSTTSKSNLMPQEFPSNKEDEILKNLPKDFTINFECSSSVIDLECIEAKFVVESFAAGSEPISINLNFTIDFKNFGEMLNFFDDKD